MGVGIPDSRKIREFVRKWELNHESELVLHALNAEDCESVMQGFAPHNRHRDVNELLQNFARRDLLKSNMEIMDQRWKQLFVEYYYLNSHSVQLLKELPLPILARVLTNFSQKNPHADSNALLASFVGNMSRETGVLYSTGSSAPAALAGRAAQCGAAAQHGQQEQQALKKKYERPATSTTATSGSSSGGQVDHGADTIEEQRLKEAVRAFIRSHGLSEWCEQELLGCDRPLCQSIMREFKPRANTRDISSLFGGFVKQRKLSSRGSSNRQPTWRAGEPDEDPAEVRRLVEDFASRRGVQRELAIVVLECVKSPLLRNSVIADFVTPPRNVEDCFLAFAKSRFFPECVKEREVCDILDRLRDPHLASDENKRRLVWEEIFARHNIVRAVDEGGHQQDHGGLEPVSALTSGGEQRRAAPVGTNGLESSAATNKSKVRPPPPAPKNLKKQRSRSAEVVGGDRDDGDFLKSEADDDFGFLTDGGEEKVIWRPADGKYTISGFVQHWKLGDDEIMNLMDLKKSSPENVEFVLKHFTATAPDTATEEEMQKKFQTFLSDVVSGEFEEKQQERAASRLLEDVQRFCHKRRVSEEVAAFLFDLPEAVARELMQAFAPTDKKRLKFDFLFLSFARSQLRKLEGTSRGSWKALDLQQHVPDESAFPHLQEEFYVPPLSAVKEDDLHTFLEYYNLSDTIGEQMLRGVSTNLQAFVMKDFSTMGLEQQQGSRQGSEDTLRQFCEYLSDLQLRPSSKEIRFFFKMWGMDEIDLRNPLNRYADVVQDGKAVTGRLLESQDEDEAEDEDAAGELFDDGGGGGNRNRQKVKEGNRNYEEEGKEKLDLEPDLDLEREESSLLASSIDRSPSNNVDLEARASGANVVANTRTATAPPPPTTGATSSSSKKRPPPDTHTTSGYRESLFQQFNAEVVGPLQRQMMDDFRPREKPDNAAAMFRRFFTNRVAARWDGGGKGNKVKGRDHHQHLHHAGAGGRGGGGGRDAAGGGTGATEQGAADYARLTADYSSAAREERYNKRGRGTEDHYAAEVGSHKRQRR